MKRLFLVPFLLFCVSVMAQGPSVAIKTVTTLPGTCRANAVYTEEVFKKAADATRGFYTCNSNQTSWDGPYASSGGATPGNVVGPASATAGDLPLLDATGKVLSDSGKAPSTDGTFGSNSDAKIPTEKAVKTYADAGDALKLNLTGGTLTDRLTLNTPADAVPLKIVGRTVSTHDSVVQFFDNDGTTVQGSILAQTGKLILRDLTPTNQVTVTTSGVAIGAGSAIVSSGPGGTLGTNAFNSTAFAPLASPTFTGTVVIPTPFTIGAVSMTATGTELNFVVGVTSAIQTQLNTKAPTASPTFTGTPLSTTAAVDTNTTQIATTAYVIAQAASANPVIDGTAAPGTSTRYARGDHVHPTDTTRAPLASPTFTGTPAGPTAAAGTNTTQLATTAFVSTPPTPTGPSYTNSWVDQGGAFKNGGYYTQGGIVFLTGTLKSGTSGQSAFTLPVGSRPTALVRCNVYSNATAGQSFIDIGSDGTVTPTLGTGGTFFSMGGCNFTVN